MTTAPNPYRCEPPEELRGVDGWHWLTRHDTLPVLGWWMPPRAPEKPFWTIRGQSNGFYAPEASNMYENGYRYLAPVTPHAEVERLRAEVEQLRDKAENVVIFYGMNWDMEGVIDELYTALYGTEEAP